ncbi:hypothetical protein [Geminocystis sp. NIES-3709]|uniref:hypothetical protein n=1 Tax=Geminocystis sp. NIES-3709 TaxID=1617448 RepID=UPI0005FC5E0B|nr:hypothetical protein [Geminocystis sp. NIES-3709]BAQ65330.1 hypothetical protein GM3709_2095 [Geminocystis sp. NIES-3709]
MKYLPFLLGAFLSLNFGNLAQAQNLPSSSEVGTLFGDYMCQSFENTGMITDDKIMEKFAESLIDKYGEENTLKLMEKLEVVFTKDNLANDRYGVDLMRSALNHIINDDSCFQVFVKELF